MTIDKEIMYQIKLSGYQLELIASAIQSSMACGVYSDKGIYEARVLLESLRDDAKEIGELY